MKHIITVQHTQSIHHINGMVGSWTDWDLTELGKNQADCIGKRLKEELEGKKAIMFSSDLKRAKQTAEEIYEQISKNPKVELSGMYDGGTWLRVSATLVEDDRVEAQEAILNDPTGPSQLYKPNDGRLVTYKLINVKALKYNFYAAPEEIKED